MLVAILLIWFCTGSAYFLWSFWSDMKTTVGVGKTDYLAQIKHNLNKETVCDLLKMLLAWPLFFLLILFIFTPLELMAPGSQPYYAHGLLGVVDEDLITSQDAIAFHRKFWNSFGFYVAAGATGVLLIFLMD